MPPSSNGGCCAHDHDCDAHECAKLWSLHEAVDAARVSCLNGSGSAPKELLRDWERRADASARVCSDVDDREMLLHVPFDKDVQCSALCVVGGANGSGPSRVRLFVNREDVDFDVAEQLPPQQELDLIDDHNLGHVEYPLRPTKFGKVRCITLHFIDNLVHQGCTELQFVGFKGRVLHTAREPPKQVIYEAKPNVQDHRTAAEDGAPSTIL
eukprot:scaffold172_cov341-Pavlova_lutheri.AAC.15